MIGFHTCWKLIKSSLLNFAMLMSGRVMVFSKFSSALAGMFTQISLDVIVDAILVLISLYTFFLWCKLHCILC